MGWIREKCINVVKEVLPLVFWTGILACALPSLMMFSRLVGGGDEGAVSPLVGILWNSLPRWIHLMGNTVGVTLGAVVISLLFGLPLGFFCFRTDLPWRRFILSLCLLSGLLPVYVTATSWMALCGMASFLGRWLGAAWVTGLAYVPWVVLLSGISFAQGDPDLEDAGRMDGNQAQIAWFVTLRAGSWGIAASSCAIAFLSLWDITVTDVFVIRTFGEEVFTQFQLGFGPSRAVALAVPVTIPCLFLAIVMTRLMRDLGKSTSGGILRPVKRLSLKRAKVPCLALVLLIGLSFWGVPWLALVKAVKTPQNLLSAWRATSKELLYTLWMAPLAATCSVLLSTASALRLVRPGWGRWILGGILLVLVSVPGAVTGVGLAELMNRPGFLGRLYDSSMGVVCIYVLRSLPLVSLAIVPGLQRIPRALWEAVEMEGGGWMSTWRSALLPLSWRFLLGGWFLALLLCLSEIGASFLVMPPGKATLSVRFFTLIHYGVYPDAAGICLLLMGFVAGIGVPLLLLVWPTLRRYTA